METFWAQFAAVKSKNRVAVKRLTSAEKDFFSGGGNTNRNDWLSMLDDSNLWKEVQKSVAQGVVNYSKDRKIMRITKDRNLIFQYTSGKWRFVEVMGD